MLVEGRHVRGKHRHIDVLVLARDAGGGIDRPPADDPPGPVVLAQHRGDLRWSQHLPGAVPAQEGVLLGLLFSGPDKRLHPRHQHRIDPRSDQHTLTVRDAAGAKSEGWTATIPLRRFRWWPDCLARDMRS